MSNMKRCSKRHSNPHLRDVNINEKNSKNYARLSVLEKIASSMAKRDVTTKEDTLANKSLSCSSRRKPEVTGLHTSKTLSTHVQHKKKKGLSGGGVRAGPRNGLCLVSGHEMATKR